jgi:excisionase family DNA binding protein
VEQFLSLRRAARRLDVSVDFLKRLRRQGALQGVKLGRAVRIPESELDRLCRTGSHVGRGAREASHGGR